MPTPQPPSDQGNLFNRVDRFLYTFSRRWLTIINVVVALYVMLPMLAPALMKVGLQGPARAIYTLYSPMCHQMASRSFFLFGEQLAYPRAIANTNLIPIEAYMPDIPEFMGVPADPAEWPAFLMPARRFIGNAQMGYKMALCARDIGIYGFVLLGGLVYGVVRRHYRIRPLPLWAFVILGMGPIGLDGFSQLFSQYGSALEPLAFLNNLFPLRESTPLLRTLTGAIFGLALVWLTFPHIDAGMQGTERDLARKLNN
jgi:uncharacterized membrane protein